MEEERYRVKVDFEIIEGRPVITNRSPIERELAEREGIPHEVVYCLTLREDGNLLIIKRAETKHPYPNHYSIPAGHVDVVSYGKPRNLFLRILKILYRPLFKYDDELLCEDETLAAERELREETGLTSKLTKRIMEDTLFFDRTKGHFGLAFLCLVDEQEPKFNEEIDPKYSGFLPPEEILKRLKTEKFTPPAKRILSSFLKRYPTRRSLEELYSSLDA